MKNAEHFINLNDITIDTNYILKNSPKEIGQCSQCIYDLLNLLIPIAIVFGSIIGIIYIIIHI